jgi:hypothetical protein
MPGDAQLSSLKAQVQNPEDSKGVGSVPDRRSDHITEAVLNKERAKSASVRPNPDALDKFRNESRIAELIQIGSRAENELEDQENVDEN